MRKIVLLMVLILIIIGCTTKKGPTGTISDLNIHKGTDGLVISFIKNSPPEEVFEEEEFPVYVLVENKGAYDVLNGYITLGFQQDYFEAATKSRNFNLEGKSLANPIGEQKIFRFLVNAKKIIGESRTVPIAVSSCYSYKTTAIESVCIDTDVYDVKAVERACSVSDVSIKGGQGGPVAVTKIESKMLTNEEESRIIPQYTIEIENVRGGNIIRTERAQDLCSATALSRDDLYVVGINVELSEQRLHCNKDSLKLMEEKDKIICRLESGIEKDKAAYTTLLKIELDYGYSETIIKNIIINEKI